MVTYILEHTIKNIKQLINIIAYDIIDNVELK